MKKKVLEEIEAIKVLEIQKAAELAKEEEERKRREKIEKEEREKRKIEDEEREKERQRLAEEMAEARSVLSIQNWQTKLFSKFLFDYHHIDLVLFVFVFVI
jgi:hypothetical protein